MTTMVKTAAVAALASLALAGAAQADSISFIRGGDIWVAAPDGSGQAQLTKDGGYGYQSRADDGSFIALHGRRLRRLAPDGRLLAEFDTPVSGEQAGPRVSYFRGPFKPEISPDGAKVAYEYWYQEYATEQGCAPNDPRCSDSRVSVGIGYSHADRQTSWDEPGLGRQSGWTDPSWIGNDTLLQSDKSVLPNVDAIIDHPGDGNQAIERWFEDTSAWHVRDGEVSRRGDAAAFVTTLPRSAADPKVGQEDDQITIYGLKGAAPALPESCFAYQDAEASFQGPSFAPDGEHLTWTSKSRATGKENLMVGDVPSQAGRCRLPGQGSRVLIEDAYDPDWSPAPVPVPAVQAAGSPGGAPGGSARLRVTVRRIPLARALRSGLTLTVEGPSAGTVRVRAAQRRQGAQWAVASGAARAASAGRTKVTLRFTRAARRGLRGASSVALHLTTTLKPAAGPALTGRTKVRLRS